MLRDTGFSLEEIVNCKSVFDEDIINDKIDELNNEIDELGEKDQRLEIIRDELSLTNSNINVLRKVLDNIRRVA